VLISVSQVEN